MDVGKFVHWEAPLFDTGCIFLIDLSHDKPSRDDKMSQVEVAQTKATEAFLLEYKRSNDWNDSIIRTEPQMFVYKEVDGINIEADVHIQETTSLDNQSLTKRPVMLFIHGGAGSEVFVRITPSLCSMNF